MKGLVAVTGMRREAKGFGADCEIVLSGGSDNRTLAADLEAAIGRGGRAVLSAGLCGGLDPKLGPGSVILATAIMGTGTRFDCDARWRAAVRERLPVVEGPLAGSDRIVELPAQKAQLRAATGALAVDLESHIAAQLADRHGLPFCALRVIADGAQHSLPPAVHVAMTANGKIALASLLMALMREPGQLSELIVTGWRAQTAFSSLFRSLRLLGVGFACPYLG
jgi:hopanoid-associated phosphorylase